MQKFLLFGIAIVIVVALNIGSCIKLEDFTFINKLGDGKSGTVYTVMKDGRYFAMKVMNVTRGYRNPLDRLFSRSFAQTLADELKIWTTELNKLAFAVHVHWAFTEGELACLVMDYVSEGSLATKLLANNDITPENLAGTKISKLSEDRIKGIIPSALSLGKRLHDENIVHGDLFHVNILVTCHGRLMVSDFDTTRHINPKVSFLRRIMKRIGDESNIDYRIMAKEWSVITPNTDDFHGRMKKTDRYNFGELRGHTLFQGVDWNAVDGDTVHPPFPPTRCYVGIRHQTLQPLVARGTLSMKDANILKDYNYQSTEIPREL